MVQSNSTYSILLLEDPHAIHLQLAEALASFAGLAFADATAIARHSWGILAEHADEPRAQQLKSALDQAHLKSALVPDTEVATLPEAIPFKGVNFTEEIVELILPSGPIKVRPGLPPLIAAAVYEKTSITTEVRKTGPSAQQKAAQLGILLATGLPIPMGRSKEVKIEHRETDLAYHLEIFSAGVRYWMDIDHFDFSVLGDRKALNRHQNFLALVSELLRRLPGATKNRGALLASRKPPTEWGYASVADLERELRWLVTLLNKKRAS